MNGPLSRRYVTHNRHGLPEPYRSTKNNRKSSRKKSLPNRFTSSHPTKTTSWALKIQKTFRGFRVRKSVQKIISIRNEVIEIERKINNDVEFFNLIRKDPKERLRVNEMLMSLLFKLDSVHGVDFGVRVLRKSVTNKVIALQEKVDSIGQQTLHSPKHVKDSSIDDVKADIVKEVDENDVSDVKEKEKEEGLIGEIENREVVKKLMDDNENTMELMKKMTEANDMQTRTIDSLNGRVEQLEKAFMRLMKKKT
ncbi:uncharacterized protein [Rutidosis leptorrhynchoides]|uniref:uncharacterized protein n=1 Tax=Rutidosis leptorrhynchoides TaxID=125765 RepID=UPI003A98EB7E